MNWVKKLGLTLTDEEYRILKSKLGREPNDLELAMVDAEWSEHCSYKSSKPILNLLPTEGEKVLIGPGYDAGVLDVGDGYVVTLHIESHNHPSAIDPFGGAATGVGGILRDILSMGTKPIAIMNSLHFGGIDKNSHSKWLFRYVVKGIAQYGNCVGVPTVSGEVEFDDSFERNCLVDVACIGVGKIDELLIPKAEHPGDYLILIGGSTGRDGIHGSSFASRILTERSEKERSAVQIPDPFMKKLILDVLLESFSKKYVRAVKDLGGGGLSCALSELAADGGTGLEVDLDKVMLREEDMNPIEIMISESQERMILVVKKEKIKEIISVIEKYELPHSIIGRVTSDGLLKIYWKGKLIDSIPAKVVARAPMINRSEKIPSYIDELKRVEKPEDIKLKEAKGILLHLLSSPNIASKAWVYTQYDHEVGLRTVVKPGMADACVIRLPNKRFLSCKMDSDAKKCYIDPYMGAMNVVSESLSNLVAVGSNPLAIVDHLQFGDPSDPEVFWTFKEVVRGVSDYLKAIKVPCVGGKVSFYNEDKLMKVRIKPSPVITSIGIIEDESSIRTMKPKSGEDLIAVGVTGEEMGGSEYYEQILGLVGGRVPRIDPEKDKATFEAILKTIGLANSIHDCSRGGMLVVLSEMCLAGGIGCSVKVERIPSKTGRLDEILFSERPARFLISTKRSESLMELIRGFGINTELIGKFGGEDMVMESRGDSIKIGLNEMEDAWSSSIHRIMGDLE